MCICSVAVHDLLSKEVCFLEIVVIPSKRTSSCPQGLLIAHPVGFLTRVIIRDQRRMLPQPFR